MEKIRVNNNRSPMRKDGHHQEPDIEIPAPKTRGSSRFRKRSTRPYWLAKSPRARKRGSVDPRIIQGTSSRPKVPNKAINI
ncbi:hypothetical protein CHS0354_023056 [Potamilus streckersoni]|uniref:Uncharacterized protein n=1 Tax=Potamilus streckersoni TaxID=2493646 RepID=A0AAE0RW54_9BIVA|nr:hypothetical protein CHS0354_023056 [Potamilus streckersoni]